ncbi:Uma2 family endonuclease [Spirosoma koreense]
MLTEQSRQSHRYTIDEYLALEEKSEVRHEFYNGEIYAMAGGTVNHNLLIDNVKDLIKGYTKHKGCRVFSENMKVDVLTGMYMPYPDLVLTCHPFDLRGDNQVIRQPRLLVEVLSKSTARNDRGFKWQRYRKMPSLWYYMLVDQYSMTVELFSRIEETAEWINTIYEAPEDVIAFPRLGFDLSVGAIYDGIELIPEDEISADERTE